MTAATQWFTQLDFYQVIWLLPLAYLVHFLEELPRFPAWASRRLMPYTRNKFVAENVVIFSLLLAPLLMTTLLPADSLAGQVGLVLVLSAAVGFFLNVFFHGLATLKHGEYSPGAVTACLFFPPLSIYSYYLAAIQGLLTVTNVGLSILLGIVMLPLVVTTVHRVMDRKIKITRKLLIKIAVMGLAPLVVITAAKAVFDPLVINKIMIYTSPLALLPLVLKWARHRPQGAAADPRQQATGDDR